MKKTAFIFLIFLIIFSASLRVYSLMESVKKTEHLEIMVEIEKGMSGRAIANLLEKEGAIKSSTIFYLLLRLQNLNNLQAGYYSFSTSDTPQAIIEKIKRGEEANFKLTIPEGFTLEEILTRFDNLLIPDYKRELLKLELDQEISNLDLDKNINKTQLEKNLITEAEGIIIPTTYHFPMSYQEADIAKSLVNHFKNQRLELLKEAAAESNYSAYEILIIASLIEEEGKIEAEKKIIASVIYNRLAAEMPLQLDATVQYALEERKERVLYVDLEINSPYNTYKMNKLPPTPIASPGDLALKAAIKPAATNYLFYFAVDDGSHIFTESYQEHLKKQRQLLK